MQSCFLLKPAGFFAFLTLYVGTAIHINDGNKLPINNIFDNLLHEKIKATLPVINEA